MKASKEHRVPLSAPALAILHKLAEAGTAPDRPVFPGRDPRKPMSNMALLALLGRMGREDLTAHGFRSTFRDWASDRTSHPDPVIEMALAHTIGEKTKAAYARSDLLELRRALMADWGAFCDGVVPSTADVVPIRRVA